VVACRVVRAPVDAKAAIDIDQVNSSLVAREVPEQFSGQ
jgi:hypothetical protein